MLLDRVDSSCTNTREQQFVGHAQAHAPARAGLEVGGKGKLSRWESDGVVAAGICVLVGCA